MGLSYGRACFCGNDHPLTGGSPRGEDGELLHAKVDDGECGRPCGGSASYVCGGRWRDSIYELTDPGAMADTDLRCDFAAPPTTFGGDELAYEGCYERDSPGWTDDRSGTEGAPGTCSHCFGTAAMSVEECARRCAANTVDQPGKQYFAVTSGTCFCSDAPPGAAPVEDAECNRRCPGNYGEVCGGRWRNSVYSIAAGRGGLASRVARIPEDECAGVAPPQGITLGESFAGSIAGLQFFRYPPSQVRATTTSLAPPHSFHAVC
jgi:glucan endo-1,3-alpha-glucosidase